MIYWHKHHIVPRHRGGTNDKSNLVRVNVAMHAFLHKCLYEEYGNTFDQIAYRMLSGQIGAEEANRLATKAALTGRKQSAETCAKKRQAHAKKYVLTDPDGNIHNVLNLKEFSSTVGLHYPSLVNVAKGRTSQHKGWVCKAEV